MEDEFFEILPWLFQLQHQHDRLLAPVTRLEEIVSFEQDFMLPMRKSFEHCGGVKIPQRTPGHHIEPERTKNGKVQGGISLLHEPRLFATFSDSAPQRKRFNKPLHEEFSCEREYNGVKGHKRKVMPALAIHIRPSRIIWTKRIGEKDGMVERIRRFRIQGIESKDNKDDDEGIEPSMTEREIFPSAKQGSGFSSLRVRFEGLFRWLASEISWDNLSTRID